MSNSHLFPDVNVPTPLLSEVFAQAVDLPIPTDPERTSSQSPPTNQPSAASKLLFSGDKKIPKWLKMGSEFYMLPNTIFR
jgi:tether containing UBX domain for GLUT4